MHAEPNPSGIEGCDHPWRTRARRRLGLLEALSAKLADARVPHMVKHHTPNLAPSDPAERTIPALIIGDEWARARILYWSGEPFFTVWDAHTRYPTDESGIDRLAALLAERWRDHQVEDRYPRCSEETWQTSTR